MFLSFLFTPYILLLLPVLFYLLPYLRNASIRSIPGPALAAFSNLWLLYQCRKGKRYLAVDNAHKKYGTLVRIQPDHVSIADAEVIPVIYGHGTGFLKRLAPSEVYSASCCMVTVPLRGQRLLRCLREHSTWTVQHSRSSGAHSETENRVSHLQHQVYWPV